ncbi:serine hydrolase domain-containing protein [Mucilaginibacter sp. 3215]
MRMFILFLICLISFGEIAQGQSWQDTIGQIDQLFDHYSSDNPGYQLAISRHGQIIYSRAQGMADMERFTPLSKISLIEAGSVSKQFTAAAILLLQQEGKLSLDDDVRKYIPELPSYGNTITLSQMLHHTSGLKDWGSLMSLSDWPRGTKVYTNTEVLSIMTKQGSLNQEPGTVYAYSNTNYVLLAIIVERTSGETLADFTRKRIFIPAGMNHTQWRTDIRTIVPNRAIAYTKGENGFYTDMPNEDVYGNGGLLTTAEDLLRWNIFYTSGKLGMPSLFPEQLHLVNLNNGQQNNYAAGLRIDFVKGRKVISHDGATAAYRALLEYYPDEDVSIAWLSNNAESDKFTNDFTALHYLLFKTLQDLNTGISAPAAKPTYFHQIPSKLADYIGKYYSNEVESGLFISLTEGKLIITRKNKSTFTLVRTAPDKFQISDSNVTVYFERGLNHKVKMLAFATPKVHNVLFNKLPK